MKKERPTTFEKKQKDLASDFFEAVAKGLKQNIAAAKLKNPEQPSVVISFNYFASRRPLETFSSKCIEMSASIMGKKNCALQPTILTTVEV